MVVPLCEQKAVQLREGLPLVKPAERSTASFFAIFGWENSVIGRPRHRVYDRDPGRNRFPKTPSFDIVSTCPIAILFLGSRMLSSAKGFRLFCVRRMPIVPMSAWVVPVRSAAEVSKEVRREGALTLPILQLISGPHRGTGRRARFQRCC